MADVKVIPRNNSNTFIVNDASLADLYSLEIAGESSTKCDFDINFLLCDKKISLEKQCSYKDNKQKRGDDKMVCLIAEGDNSVPSSTEKTAVNTNMSLCALAKNHIENNKTLNGWHLDADFSLADLLCNSDGLISDEGNVNVFNIDLNDQNVPKKNGLSTVKCGVYDNELSKLVSRPGHELSFGPASSVSLDALAASHVQNSSSRSLESNSDKKFTDSFMFDLKTDDSDVFQFDSFADMLSGSVISSTESSVAPSELSSLVSSETSDEKQELRCETSDDDIVPDIDLSFCIKRSVKDRYSEEKSPPDSVDSGFDETDFTSNQFTSDASHKTCTKSDIFGNYTSMDMNGKDKLLRSKQSLFSKAMSARPKIDGDKRAKLKKIRRELVRNRLPPFSLNNIEKLPEESDRIVDSSDLCVIASNFLAMSDQ